MDPKQTSTIAYTCNVPNTLSIKIYQEKIVISYETLDALIEVEESVFGKQFTSGID